MYIYIFVFYIAIRIIKSDILLMYKYHALFNYMLVINFIIIGLLSTICLSGIKEIRINIIYILINIIIYIILFYRFSIYINELLIMSGVLAGNLILNNKKAI